MKSEPSAYSWETLVKEGRTEWNGVRNYLANNNMKAMKISDKAFFYHSNEGLAVVGLMKIIELWHPDPSDEKGKFGMVTVAPLKPMKKPVALAAIKAEPALAEMVLLRQGRLSVSPVTTDEWQKIMEMGGF